MGNSPYSGIRETLESHRRIIIAIKGSPDPDALASSYALQILCRAYGGDADLIATTPLSLERNREFADLLKIPLQIMDTFPDPKHYDGYAILDHQSPLVATLSGNLPCAFHIDHHEAIEPPLRPEFRLVDTSAGSTATLISLVFKELNPPLDAETKKNLFTALLYGIHSDTDKYEHASKIDYDAIKYLSPHIDQEIFNRISGIILDEEMLASINRAIDEQVLYRDWLVTGLSYIDYRKRDSIAIIADYLLKRHHVDTVVVYAAIVNDDKKTITIDASIRTRKSYTNLNEVIKSITADGGGRKFKGAFQVPVDYFYSCPDRELLWKVISLTTTEILRKRRDAVYLHDLAGAFHVIKAKLAELFDFKKPEKS